MIEALETILGIIQQVWEIISSTWSTIGTALLYLTDTIPTILLVTTYLPSVVGTVCTLAIVIGIIKFVIAR